MRCDRTRNARREWCLASERRARDRKRVAVFPRAPPNRNARPSDPVTSWASPLPSSESESSSASPSCSSGAASARDARGERCAKVAEKVLSRPSDFRTHPMPGSTEHSLWSNNVIQQQVEESDFDAPSASRAPLLAQWQALSSPLGRRLITPVTTFFQPSAGYPFIHFCINEQTSHVIKIETHALKSNYVIAQEETGDRPGRVLVEWRQARLWGTGSIQGKCMNNIALRAQSCAGRRIAEPRRVESECGVGDGERTCKQVQVQEKNSSSTISTLSKCLTFFRGDDHRLS